MTHFLDRIKEAEDPQAAEYKRSLDEFSKLESGSYVTGSRNEHLNKLAFRGGLLVAQDVINEDWVFDELTEACELNGYTGDYGESETDRIIRAGLTAGYEATPKVANENPIYDWILTADQLASLPPVDWLVEDLLVANGLVVLVGEPGIGKSLMAIDLAASICTLPSWHGRKIGQSGKVVYLAGEGLSGLNNRRMAWEKINKASLGDKLCILPRIVDAGSSEWDWFVEYVGDVKPALIVIDTLAKTAGAFEENTPSEMSKYLRQCDRLRVASGGTVLILHHPNKGGGYRGGTSIKGDVDTLMFLYEEGREDISLHVNKNKDGPEGDFGLFRLKKNIRVGTQPDGKAIESAVFVPAMSNPFEEFKQ